MMFQDVKDKTSFYPSCYLLKISLSLSIQMIFRHVWKRQKYFLTHLFFLHHVQTPHRLTLCQRPHTKKHMLLLAEASRGLHTTHLLRSFHLAPPVRDGQAKNDLISVTSRFLGLSLLLMHKDDILHSSHNNYFLLLLLLFISLCTTSRRTQRCTTTTSKRE